MTTIISGPRSSGKTRRLIELASKDTNSIIVSSNPEAMRRKIKEYGHYIPVVGYKEFCNQSLLKFGNYYLDNIEEYIRFKTPCYSIAAYTITTQEN